MLPLLQFYTLGPLERHAGSQSVEAGHAGANQWPWIISSLYSPASFLFSCALCSLGPCRLCLAATHHMIPVRSQSLSCRSFLLFPHSLGQEDGHRLLAVIGIFPSLLAYISLLSLPIFFLSPSPAYDVLLRLPHSPPCSRSRVTFTTLGLRHRKRKEKGRRSV